jgi:hypothetical protein
MTSAAPVPLFLRSVRLVVGTLNVTGLRVTFSVAKSLKPEPNKAEISVYNLSEASRAQLEQLQEVPVQLDAGYEAGSSTLFLGTLRTALTVRDGPDLVTSLGAGDGEKQIRSARVSVSVRKQTSADVVLRDVARALGVGEGNLADATKTLKFSTVGQLFAQGTVLTGNAAREMTHLCRSLGLTWSIQDGKLQLLPLATALAGAAVLLSPSTGLVDSPSVDNAGVLSARMLMAPDVFPGRLLVLDSERLKGQYRIESTTHVGDTHGSDWYIDLEARRY